MSELFSSPTARIIAHSEVQLATFLRNHHVDRGTVRRVFTVDDIRGIDLANPLYLLPSWFENRDAVEAVRTWQARGGKCEMISEETVRNFT